MTKQEREDFIEFCRMLKQLTETMQKELYFISEGMRFASKHGATDAA